jgi:hypothetical protein
MEMLTALVVKVTEEGLLSSFCGCTEIQQTSIYADDVVMFWVQFFVLCGRFCLFVCRMEVLTAMVVKVTEEGLLSSFCGCTEIQQTSIYADDVVMFIKPTVSDLVAARETLKIFGTASGLQINYRKSSAT